MTYYNGTNKTRIEYQNYLESRWKKLNEFFLINDLFSALMCCHIFSFCSGYYIKELLAAESDSAKNH